MTFKRNSLRCLKKHKTTIHQFFVQIEKNSKAINVSDFEGCLALKEKCNLTLDVLE
jgi:hypothetical protein